jgi:outer membrane protein assembly factor BamA
MAHVIIFYIRRPILNFMPANKSCRGWILIVFSIVSFFSFAQGIPSGGGGSDEMDEEKNFQFVPIPYINYDRSLEFQFGALPMAMYKVNQKDTISPASISGIFGMYTTNKSWFALGFQQLYLNEDRWRITLAAGGGSINFQTYAGAPFNKFIKYNTGVNFFYIEGQRKVFEDFYLGLAYTYSEFGSQLDVEGAENTPTQYLNGIGPVVSYDKRDDVYYPHHGMYTNANWNTYPEFFGNKTVLNRIEVDYNNYFSSREEKDVIAARFYGGFGLGDVPFEQQFIVGQEDIRGYSEGKYRGEQLLALQGEYRWNFIDRWSAVGFAGVATVFNTLNGENDGAFLPGIGAGFRYNILEKYHMNVGLDFAVGKDDWGLYFRIGEAF